MQEAAVADWLRASKLSLGMLIFRGFDLVNQVAYEDFDQLKPFCDRKKVRDVAATGSSRRLSLGIVGTPSKKNADDIFKTVAVCCSRLG